MQPLTNLLPSECVKIAEEVKVPLVYLVKAITFLEEGATIPFLARYRQEATGNLDEPRLRLLARRLEYFRDLQDRRQAALRSIEERGKLTADLRARLETAQDPCEIEDLVLPFKPRRKARADHSREKGLHALADWLWNQQADGRAPQTVAESLLCPEKGVESVEQALAGARDILAERISETAAIRGELRQMMWAEGVVASTKSEKADGLAQQQKEAKPKYQGYYDFHEPVSRIPSHRLLAIRRGVKEGFLNWEIKLEEAKPIESLLSRVIRDRESPFAPHLEAAARDSFHRLLGPALEGEVRAALQERSEAEAIRFFQENLRNLLLRPPAGPIRVLALDPGLRSGCQAAVIDESAQCLFSGVIHPNEPNQSADSARAALKELIVNHNVRAVAIGNGTGSREIDLFVRSLLRDEKLDGVFSVVVSEAGASAYASSRLAREEYPDLDVAVRGAVSIARRLQDPLAELVKVDPRSIGVGQYQHDVDQEKLGESLQATVESCVNQVGVDAHTASFALLRNVAGVNERLAKRILEHRHNTGRFRSRAQLKQVPGFSEQAFQQAAGFLRIREGENPLDQTGIHPESYPVVEKMAARAGVSVPELLLRPDLVESLPLEEFQTETAGVPTLTDIRHELLRGDRDRRGKFVPPLYRNNVLLIADLKAGMEVEGMVTNVTNFGAFVDVGVQQDGLVHISELPGKSAKDPQAAVKVGDLVKVRVLSADATARRISLSMRPAPAPKVASPPAARPVEKKKAPAPAASKSARPAPSRAPAANGKPKPPRPAPPQAKPLTMEEKLALLQAKFRTRV